MDWTAILGTIIASVVASAILTGAGAIIAIVRIMARFESKFENIKLQLEGVARDFDNKLVTATTATTQRVEDYKLWRAGLEARLESRAHHLAEHEKECRDRWEKLWKEHGALMAQMEQVLLNTSISNGGKLEQILKAIQSGPKSRRGAS
jgi:hypothetical protein